MTETGAPPALEELHLDRSARVLHCRYADGAEFALDCEYLRTHSPSAEVRGHGLSEPKLIRGKEGVNITRIEPIGSYAVVLMFDDGHDSGIYSFDFLYRLGHGMEGNKARYRDRLDAAGPG